MDGIALLLDKINVQVPFGRWQLFEFCDLTLVPPFVKHCCQNTLTAQWTKRMPLLQRQYPAKLAADAVLEAIDGIGDIDTADWEVIDFCSGGGGPVPYIEKLVNDGRKREGKRPIPFRLSDLYPNLNAWMQHAALSENLSFVPQPVDASNPPLSVISATPSTNQRTAAAKHDHATTSGGKVCRLFCLAFHHFDDATARRVLKSTLETSDAFAILELQDRRTGSLVLMLLEFWLVLLISALWFWHDPVHLLLTYVVPVLPFVHSFDGFVSCLRTRTFEETIRLLDDRSGADSIRHDRLVERSAVHIRDWEFTHASALHTWPLGYMSITFGKRVESSNGDAGS
ncbi:hypothetical protein LTR53_007983 [Teratosphaeriaceae sp. CCFEE 6253]|nr:hypothetical protein LTR53_007983 [Teratosphaeriaceae sp. CCFEE 6253]